MEILETGPLSAAHRDEIEAGERDPFGAGRIGRLEWRPKDRHVLVRDGGRLVASAGIVVADVRVAGGPPFAVAGLGGVIVTAARRGEGLARVVVDAALERAAALGPDLALLFCLDDRAGLYERLGFAAVAGPVTVEQPSGPTEMPLRSMWRPLRPGAGWPPGPVAVLGQPF
jgi:predicted N-acetyltransferase YhbS